MTRYHGASRRALVALAAATLTAAPALTQQVAKLTALAQLEPGLWQLRDLEDRSAEPQSLCVADPNLLLQVQHREAACQRTIIDDGLKAATVHYTCPANGFGRTSLRVETSKLAKIDTQGISHNVPFAYRMEARRTGECAVSASR
ncbi:MAG TPA: hypothetical protein VGW34_10280 [Allosphingosinicella sp.]|nr:hypothetical protein [Allosphingosinicella sp.]